MRTGRARWKAHDYNHLAAPAQVKITARAWKCWLWASIISLLARKAAELGGEFTSYPKILSSKYLAHFSKFRIFAPKIMKNHSGIIRLQ
jgi:hypothetical protein